MAYRILVGFLLAATLAACSGNGIAGSSSSQGASTSAVSSGSGITVTASPITLHGVPASSATVGVNYNYQPTVPANSGVVTFAIAGQPSWASFDASTGTLSGTPSTNDVGLTGDITIIASNGSNTGSVGPFTIRVNPAAAGSLNAAPVIIGAPGTSVSAGQSYTFQPQASDAAGQPLTYGIFNCPVWATFDTATGKLSGTPNSSQVGSYTDIDIFVTDGTTTAAALPEFTIQVMAVVPGAPVVGGTPPATVVAGQPYAFQPTASDPASKTLTFSIANAPSWARFNATTGALSGTPTAAQEGAYPGIVITASDGSLSTSLPAFTITVTGSGAPGAPLIGGTPATSVVEGQAYNFQPTSSASQGESLQFSIVNRPTWASFNTATGDLSGTPTAAETGSYPSIVISVSNGSSSASLPAFGIVVTKAAPAGAPTISGSPQTSVIAGDAYSFTPTSTDPSGGTLTFSIKNAPSWASFNSATGELSGTPTAADVGTSANIIISVSDGKTSASLPAFPIAVTENATGSVTLNWMAPSENTDGTPLTDLAGYYLYYGRSANAMTETVRISNSGVLTYVLSNLSPGTWYFAVTAYTTADVQSGQSAVASETLL
jgi:hypothetical protein